MQKFKTKLLNFCLPALLPVSLLLIWQIASQLNLISTKFFPAPSTIIKTAYTLVQGQELFKNVTISLYRATLGLGIGASLGILLGLLTGLSHRANQLLDSTIQMIRNIPHLALLPLVIAWFGVGETSKIFLVAVGVFFPLYANTVHGIQSVDPELIEMGHVYQLSRWQLFTDIIFPSALPAILVGLRYALGIMWTTLIVAETIASDSGIGYMAMNAREFMQMDVILVSILIYALLGKISDLIAKFFENEANHWQINE